MARYLSLPFGEFMNFNTGDTAWILVASALVLLMTPGLAFFYGGMVRGKNVLGMLAQNYVTMGIVSVLWITGVYSLAFSGKGKWIGDLHQFGLNHIWQQATGFESLTIPPLVFCAFQLMFAIITPALITGGTADRLKFGAWSIFCGLWLIVVYAPVAHWVFSPSGWLFKLGALDFAGGTVVHANAGAAALAVILVIGKRKGWPKERMRPHNVPFVLLGAGLLAITPACGFVSPMGSIAIGFAAGIVCALAVGLKNKFGFDDALDVVGVHLVGGVLGALLIGLFATKMTNGAGANGAFYKGGWTLMGHQVVAVAAVVAYSFIATYILAQILNKTIGLRVDEEAEQSGLDLSQHAETAYENSSYSDGSRFLSNFTQTK